MIGLILQEFEVYNVAVDGCLRLYYQYRTYQLKYLSTRIQLHVDMIVSGRF